MLGYFQLVENPTENATYMQLKNLCANCVHSCKPLNEHGHLFLEREKMRIGWITNNKQKTRLNELLPKKVSVR